jgi:hypothetical protein
MDGLLLHCSQILGHGFEIEVITTMKQNGSTLIIPGRIVREESDEAGAVCRLGVELLWPDARNKAWEELLAKH